MWSRELACDHGGFAVRGVCWALSDSGGSCPDICGGADAVDIEATRESAASSDVVYCMEASRFPAARVTARPLLTALLTAACAGRSCSGCRASTASTTIWTSRARACTRW